VSSHAPEHLFHGFGGLAVSAVAHVALEKHLAGILGEIYEGQIRGKDGKLQEG